MTPEGTPIIRQGMAAERCMSVADAEMRHGRKRRSLLADGYTRHGLRDVDARLMVAGGVTPANAPEARVTDASETDLAAQQCTLQALPIDRADLASPLVQQRTETLAFFARLGRCSRGHFAPKRPSRWLGTSTSCHVRAASRCPLSPAAWWSFPRPHGRIVPCDRGVPRAPRAAASVFIPMKPWCKSCGHASRRRKGVRKCGSVWPWNMPWRTWALARPTRPLPWSAQQCV
jgi:hypothetical protein